MPYTLAEAAVACGLDTTVRRAVRAGKISGTKDEAGTWHVEPVELHRVFPPASRTEDDTTAVPLHPPSDAATDILVDELRAIIRVSERREEDLRQERDRWRTALLDGPCSIARPRASSRDCYRKIGSQRAIEKRAFKTEQ
jgi:hypothetical protein